MYIKLYIYIHQNVTQLDIYIYKYIYEGIRISIIQIGEYIMMKSRR